MIGNTENHARQWNFITTLNPGIYTLLVVGDRQGLQPTCWNFSTQRTDPRFSLDDLGLSGQLEFRSV